jgi:hypothetical protein
MAEETTAELGYGSLVEISTDDGATYASGGQVSGDITPPNAQIDTVDATHMQSPNGDKEYILGLNDPGQCSYPIHFNASSTVDALYRSVKAARARVKVRITFPNAATWTFTALLTGYAPAIPIADRQTAEVTWKVSGSTVVA